MEPIRFVPAACAEQPAILNEDGSEKKAAEPASFSGHLMIVPPTQSERLELICDCGFDLNEKGEVKGGMNQLRSMAKMIRASKPFVALVDMIRLSDGCAFTSFDDLDHDTDGGKVLVDVAQQVMRGFKLSKK